MQPDVSFVIAAFNAEDTIGRAIASALAQRDVTVEVVIVDDCSSDRTVAVARSFPADQVRVVELGSNSGPGGARNAGLDARIAVDNLDIVREPAGEAETMFPRSLLEALPEITLAGFIDANLLFEKTFSLGYMKPIFERRFIEQNALRYVETLRIGEDYIFLASALARGGRCVVEPSAGYAYHVGAGSISRVLELHHVEAMLAADAAFLREHRLDAAAQAAQARRTRSHEEAASFLMLVQHLKQRAPLSAMKTALRDPRAVRHLKMPIAVRLRRLGASFTSRKALDPTG